MFGNQYLRFGIWDSVFETQYLDINIVWMDIDIVFDIIEMDIDTDVDIDIDIDIDVDMIQI